MSAEELRKILAARLEKSGSTAGPNGIANRLGIIFVSAHSDRPEDQQDALQISGYTDLAKLKTDSHNLVESLRPHLTSEQFEGYFDPTLAQRLASQGHPLRS